MESIRNTIANYSPKLIELVSQRQAAVALVLRGQQNGPEILFIQRATAKEDPWSGQIAFPGGGRDPEDSSVFDTAVRETREEIGFDLNVASYLGQLDDHQGRNNNRALNLIISCFVFELLNHQQLQPNYEVAEAFWVPLSLLTNPSQAIQYQTEYRKQPYPAINLGTGSGGQERILWGLTYRFTQQLLTLLAQLDY